MITITDPSLKLITLCSCCPIYRLLFDIKQSQIAKDVVQSVSCPPPSTESALLKDVHTPATQAFCLSGFEYDKPPSPRSMLVRGLFPLSGELFFHVSIAGNFLFKWHLLRESFSE